MCTDHTDFHSHPLLAVNVHLNKQKKKIHTSYILTINYFLGDLSGMKKKPLKINLKYYMLDGV